MAGGTGSVTATNAHLSQVQETGSATSRSGNSIALAPTPAPGASPAPGITTASSGAASSTGVLAQNTVSNTQAGAVAVQGQSQAPVAVTALSGATINDTAASLAQSGQAWAVAAGANGAPSNVKTPVVTGGAPNSVSVSTTGLSAANTVSTSSNATVTVPGSSAPTAPINVQPSDSVSIVNGASATAASGSTGIASGGAPLTAAGVQAARAASGATSAEGVVAQNTVNTNARVSVDVHGQNFAPIQVVINSLTQILNWGAATASSGDATATGNGGGTTSQSSTKASSGDVQVTGATVQNTVNMQTSASVHVTGDNHSPINVMLNLAADLLNWGLGAGQSGDAQAGGAGGGGTASSGRVSATGLQVVNLVNMWADASVEVDGNNYAPITVIIDFNTRIRNYGAASAASGNVAVGGPAATGSASSAPQSHSSNPAGVNGSSGGTVSSGSSSWTVGAKGGNTVAVANSADATITSMQIAGGNGGGSVSSAMITQLLQSMPSDAANPLLQRQLPSAATPTPQAGITSTGGDSVATGMHTTLQQQNIQMAACQDPEVACLSRNLAAMTFSSADVSNPLDPTSNQPGSNQTGSQSDCGICANGSFVGVNSTPTPTPSPKTNTGTGSAGTQTRTGSDSSDAGGSNGGSRHRSFTQFTTISPGLMPTGYTVDVDLWDQWPGRRLPPMPNMQTHKPAGTDVNVSLNGWPGADELPMPSLIEVASSTGPAPAASGRTPARLIRTASSDQGIGANSEDDDGGPLPLLGIYNVSAGWPDAEALPMPVPAARSSAAVATSTDDSSAAAADQADSTGPGGLEAAVVALLGAVLALLGATPRGRLLLRNLVDRGARAVRRVRRVFVLPPRNGGMFRGTARRLTALRLILSAMRLWILSVLRLG
ncbi:MAG: hypothetical protein JO020_17090 [Chloroflexi bacterium]|nr:hypothetical protein [Chloroflexota bacterium]